MSDQSTGAPDAETQRKSIALLDLDSMGTLDEAVDSAGELANLYHVIARSVLRESGPLNPARPWMDLFFQSMIVRVRGLHEGAVREIRADNPHGTNTLLRAWVEDVALLRYVIDHPEYVEKLAQSKKSLGPGGRVRVQALIDHASSSLPGLAAVYGQLCEAAHFGNVAFWASYSLEEEDAERYLNWNSVPSWREEEQALIACGRVHELARESRYLLQLFLAEHLPTGESSQST